MNFSLPVLNAFIEDTCVLMVIAYLLARGRMLALLVAPQLNWRRAGIIGVTLGLVALTEAIFPGLRSPYVLHTLIITFATLVCGLRVGLIAVGTVLLGVSLFPTSLGLLETLLTLLASALVAEGVRRLPGARYGLLYGLTAGLCAQGAVVTLHQLPLAGFHAAVNSTTIAHAAIAITANGFGVMLLQLLLNDARMRADSERHRLEAERAHALVAESQLVALRARVHPHFLFNALTSIAALCSFAPERAERAVLRLSQLMRRALDLNIANPIPLSEEIDYVRGYLEIETARYGPRLRVLWDIDPATETVRVPAFALQTLVENAIGHGIAPRSGPGHIHIVARVHGKRILIAVQDDGVGMSRGKREEGRGKREEKGTLSSTLNAHEYPRMPPTPTNAHERPAPNARVHGMDIVNDQLVLQYGGRARLRVFSREGAGTLVAFGLLSPSPPRPSPTGGRGAPDGTN